MHSSLARSLGHKGPDAANRHVVWPLGTGQRLDEALPSSSNRAMAPPIFQLRDKLVDVVELVPHAEEQLPRNLRRGSSAPSSDSFLHH